MFDGFKRYFVFRLSLHYGKEGRTNVGEGLRAGEEVVFIAAGRARGWGELEVGLGQGAGRGELLRDGPMTSNGPRYSCRSSSARRELGGDSSLVSCEKICSRRFTNAIYYSIPAPTLIPAFFSAPSTLDIAVRV